MITFMRNLSNAEKPSPEEFVGKIVFRNGESHWDSLTQGRLVVGVGAKQSLLCVRLPIKMVRSLGNEMEYDYVIDTDKLSGPIDLSDAEMRTRASVKASCDTLEEALTLYKHNAVYHLEFERMVINSKMTLKALDGISQPPEHVWKGREQAISNYTGDIIIPEVR